MGDGEWCNQLDMYSIGLSHAYLCDTGLSHTAWDRQMHKQMTTRRHTNNQTKVCTSDMHTRTCPHTCTHAHAHTHMYTRTCTHKHFDKHIRTCTYRYQ